MSRLGRVKRMSPKEVLEGLSIEHVKEGYKRGFSLSRLLEHMCPTEQDDKTGLDAFSRVLMAGEIYTRSIPEEGVMADTWEDAFDESMSRRLLGAEWLARQWRRAVFGRPMAQAAQGQRAPSILNSEDYVVGSWERPFSDASMYRLQQIEPAIPLNELVAVTTPIDSDTYRAMYIEDVDPDSKRFVRVGQSGEVPRMRFQSSERTIPLYKYGRAIEATYEVMRRQRLDRMAIEIALMAVQVEVDKVSTALTVLVEGDGNVGTAAPVTNLSQLDPALAPVTGATKPSLDAWLAAKMLFKNPYHATTLLAQQGPVLKAMLINTGTANVPLVLVANALGLGGFTLINQTLKDGVSYGIVDDAPANEWVLFDRRFALERVYEIAANITETQKFAVQQTDVLVMTEVEGYAKMDKRAAHRVNLAA